MQGLKKFYVRAEIKDGEVRGMTILYDQATEPIMDPVVVAMSSAFTRVPRRRRRRADRPAAQRKVEYGTGIVVSAAGHILTDRQLDRRLQRHRRAGGYGDADRLAEDKAADLALLRVYGAPDLVPAALAGDGREGPDLTLVGIADPQSQGGGARSRRSARKAQGRRTLEPAPQLGFSGAAALDGQGRFVGMVRAQDAGRCQAGASRRAAAGDVVPAPTIRAFLDGAEAGAGDRPSRRRRRQGLGGAGDLRAEVNRFVIVLETSPAASRRTPPCLPSGLRWRTARGTRAARSSTPSASEVSKRALTASLAASTDGSDIAAMVSATFIASSIRLAGRHHARHQAGALGLGGVHHAAGQDQVHRLGLADRARQPLRAADAGDDAELDLRLAELGVVGGDDEVALHRELAAAAERKAGDRRDHRLARARKPHRQSAAKSPMKTSM